MGRNEITLRPISAASRYLIFCVVWCASALGRESAPLVVTRATLWTESGLIADQEVLIEAGRVAAVGKSGEIPRSSAARVIDAEGDTLLPGLIDAHVHLSSPARLPEEFAAHPRENIYRVTGKQLLRSGVTAGRIHLWDLPSAITFKQDSADSRFPAPRLALAGPAFFGGHPDWNSPHANGWGVKNADDARAKVCQLHDAGMSWVSIHDPHKFKGDELSAILEEARRLGLRIMIAGDRIAAVEATASLDVDSIDYLDFSDTPMYPTELLNRLKARPKPVTLVPMPGNRQRFGAFRRGEMPLDDPSVVEFLPAPVAQFALNALREDRSKETSFTRQFDAAEPSLPDKFRQLRASGLPIAIGTDCGSTANFHADAVWWELETWRKLGVPAHDILRAATVNPAALLAEPDIGHLRIGARGDFVLYRGKIDEGAFALDRVRAVARDGRLFVDEGKWRDDPEPIAASPLQKDESRDIVRSYCTNFGPISLTFKADGSVTGTYRISVKTPADEGTITGTLKEGLLDARWTEPHSAGRLLLAFSADFERVFVLFNSDRNPREWLGEWRGVSQTGHEKLSAAQRAELRCE